MAHLADELEGEWRAAGDENDDRNDRHVEEQAAAAAADVATAQVEEAFS